MALHHYRETLEKVIVEMNEQQKQIIENYIAAYNDFDLDGMVRDLHPDVVFENTSNGEVNLRTESIAAFREQAEAATQYFTEREQTASSWEFKDQLVIVHIDYRAVLAVDLPNGMKAGDTLQLKGTSEFRFRDGKVIGIADKS